MVDTYLDADEGVTKFFNKMFTIYSPPLNITLIEEIFIYV